MRGWEVPEWEYDFPCVILKPVLRYSPNGDNPDSFIEEICIDLCCGEDLESNNIDDDLKWVGSNLKTIQKVAKERLDGKPTWKTKIREVVKQKVKFFEEEDGDLSFEVLETIKV